MSIGTYLERAVAQLSDDDLATEVHCAERCALLSTRTRRELALLRLRCLQCELARRGRRRAAFEQSRTPDARSIGASTGRRP